MVFINLQYLIMFFFCFCVLAAENHEVAFVEYLKYSGKIDKETGCLKYTWESIGKRYKIAELKNIMKVVHVLPIFKENSDSTVDEFLINRFLFK